MVLCFRNICADETQKQLFQIEGRDHGGGPVKLVWHPEGTFLATSGSNRIVRIYDRRGSPVDVIALDGICISLAWTEDGDVLACAAQGTPIVILWDSNTKKSTKIDLSLKAERDLTFVTWSPGGVTLAAGTAKGNLVMFYRKTSKKDAILGKHNKRIVTGVWSSDGRLALAGDDRVISISGPDGSTQMSYDVKGEPSQLQWAADKVDGRKTMDVTVSAVAAERNLVLCDTRKPDNTVELHFESSYGTIVRHQWFGDGYILVGFSGGQAVAISTCIADGKCLVLMCTVDGQEVGKELLSQKFGSVMADVCACTSSMRAAIIADDTVRFVDLNEWKEASEERMQIPGAQRAAWSADGRLLAIATVSGEVGVYVARLPALGASFGTRVAWRSSLREILVADVSNTSKPVRVEVATEPSLLAVGPTHIAVAMNNRVWYYRTPMEDFTLPSLIAEREYIATVEALSMNETHTCILSKGSITMHAMEAEDLDSEETHTFPGTDHDPDITCMAVTREFLVYGTAAGSIVHYSLQGNAVVNEFKHSRLVRAVFPNVAGTRVVVVDEQGSVFILNPVTDEAVGVPVSGGADAVIWDQNDWGVFAVCNKEIITTCVHSPSAAEGASMTSAGQTRRPSGLIPVACLNGGLVCASSGQLRTVPLSSHDALLSGDPRRRFAQCLSLQKFQAAWEVALVLNHQDAWLTLASNALMQLDLQMAIRAYRMVGDAGMVLALQQLETVEDRLILAGHVAILRGYPDKAQDFFMRSPQPVLALEMRMDLLQWDDSLNLARKLAPERVPSIARKCAQQYEFRGDYPRALQMYQLGLEGAAGPHTAACKAGSIRMMLRTGDVSRGVALATRMEDPTLWRDCAVILESMKQWNDAAMLYEKSDAVEKAAAIHIQAKNWSAAAPLMPRIVAPRLHALFAKAKEAEGAYKEAAIAYEHARDWDAVVRLLLTHLHDPERAFSIVRKTRSQEGAQLASKYCQTAGDYGAAIEFLLLARRGDDAFALASTHDAMDRYANAIGDHGTVNEYTAIAAHYEERGQTGKAGHFYAKAGQYHRALRLLLLCGESELDKAVEVVGEAKNDQLTSQLLDFLMGETDGVPKNQNYVFKLYMALGKYELAADAAVAVARQEMELGQPGSYKVARDLLRDVLRDLQAHHITVSTSLQRDLTLVHSYLLVRPLIQHGDHMAAARMLIRTAKYISRFPQHVVPILTSAVVECQRAGLKRAAFDFATTLMKPEYRKQIAPAYSKPIERVVRHPEKSEDEPEPTSPCPYCSLSLPITQLDCPKCKNNLPCCIASGKHLVLDDWTNCPSCRMPALYSEFKEFVSVEQQCPMCEAPVAVSSITRVEDPTAQLQRHATKDEDSTA